MTNHPDSAIASDTRNTVETIVAEALNILEHDYDIEGLESLGMPTVQEIAKRICDEHTYITAKAQV